MMSIRLYTEKDHAMLSAWWIKWNWPVMPHEYLPQLGLISSTNAEDLAAGFLYRTDSPIAWLEWLVGNPEAPKYERRKALNQVISALENEARLLGAKLIYTSASHSGLKKRLETLGFMKTEESISMFMKEIH